MINVSVAIIGSGTAGLNALSQVKKQTSSFVLINGGFFGTTCARVGCMPSKAIIQVADDFHRKHIYSRVGVDGADNLVINTADVMEHTRHLRDVLVDRVKSGSTDNMPKDKLIKGFARFLEPNVLEVNKKKIKAEKIIIATGSSPVFPAEYKIFGDKVISTDDLFELEELPKSMAVIGLGAIGLELGQALNRLGVEITGFDALTSIAGIDDEAINKTAIELLSKEYPIYLGEKVTISKEGKNIKVSSKEKQVLVEKVLLSIGRKPNLAKLDLQNAGISLNKKGMPTYNPCTMQVEDSHIFLAGDVTAERTLLHEASDEGKIAGFNAVNEKKVHFKRKEKIGIVFTDPNIISVGATLQDLNKDDISIGQMQMGPVGRAFVMGQNKGLLRIYADKKTAVLKGAQIISVRGENLAHLLVWAITEKMTVHRMLQMPFYHPVIEEALQGALYDCKSKLDIKIDTPILELQAL
jgi:dihydrolipoamide dehydrogenase